MDLAFNTVGYHASYKVFSLREFVTQSGTSRCSIAAGNSAMTEWKMCHLEILDVLGTGELRQTGCCHQCKQIKEESAVASQDHIGLFTVYSKPVGAEKQISMTRL